jgi:hypothetical protein
MKGIDKIGGSARRCEPDGTADELSQKNKEVETARPEPPGEVIAEALKLYKEDRAGRWHVRAPSPNMMQSDVRFLHEKEGVRLSREVLQKTGWPQTVIEAVAEIIDGHDTRPQARSLNDRLVRDADKLWRFTVTGVAVACDWFKMTPHAYADRLEKQVAILETEAGREMAARELARTRGELMLHLI